MNEPENKTYKSLINRVDDGFNYFNDYRLEEMNTDDTCYVKAFMKHIEELELRTKELRIRGVKDIIEMIKEREVDGENMQHILEETGMDFQMYKQLNVKYK